MQRVHWRVEIPLVLFLGVSLALAFVVFRFFLLTFTVALSVAILLSPLHHRLSARLGHREALSAALLVLACTVVILIPVLSYGLLLGQQALSILEWVRPFLEPREWDRLWREIVPAKAPRLAHWLREVGWQVPPLTAWMERAASTANHYVQVFLTGALSVLLDLVIFLMMVFFLLRDGDEVREGLRGISPFTREQETELFDHLANTVRAVLQAMIAVPLVQGLVAYAGFLIFGLPSALLWSVMVVAAALIPIVGSPLAWVPAALYFFATGATGKGIGLLLYGLLVISMVDNIVKPMILKGSAQIHTMLGFLSILGGAFAFGPKGVIAGPVILSLVLSAYRIYRYDVLRWREQEEHEEAVGPAARAEESVALPVRAGS